LLSGIAKLEWHGLALFWNVLLALCESRKTRRPLQKIFKRCAKQEIDCQAECLKQALPCIRTYRDLFDKYCTRLTDLPFKPWTVRISLKLLEKELDAWEDLLEDYVLSTSEELHELVSHTVNALQAA